MLAGSLVVMLLSQAPQTADWTMELGGGPVAVISVSRTPGKFTWTVRTLFRSRGRRVLMVPLDEQGRDERGRIPEGLWFWKQPLPGCVTGFDEESLRTGELCLEPGEGKTRHGTALGQPFTAEWDDSGTLARLEVSGAVYRPGVAWEGADPWQRGVPVEGTGDSLRLSPDVAGATVLQSNPRPSGVLPIRGDCQKLASAAVQASRGTKESLLGLVVEKGKAYPHAWVRVLSTGQHEDPSVPEGERPERIYLALDRKSAGAVYVDLLNGNLKLQRR